MGEPRRVALPLYGASDSWADQTFAASAKLELPGGGTITGITLRQRAASPDPLDGVVFIFLDADPVIALDAALSALTVAKAAGVIGLAVLDSAVHVDKFLPASAALHLLHRGDLAIKVPNGGACWCVAFNNTGGALATSTSEAIDAIVHYDREV